MANKSDLEKALEQRSKRVTTLKNEQKSSTSGCFVAVITSLSILIPFVLMYFLDMNWMIAGYGVIVIAALLITSSRENRHYSVNPSSEADHYLKMNEIEITYRYDKYTHTT